MTNDTVTKILRVVDASHLIFEIIVGKRRIRLRTTLNLNDAIFDRFYPLICHHNEVANIKLSTTSLSPEMRQDYSQRTFREYY